MPEFRRRFAVRKIRVDRRSGTVIDMSIEVPLDELFGRIRGWGFGYLLTVSDDGRPHLLALRPDIVRAEDGTERLRFDAGGGRACRNADARPNISIVFPPVDHSDGYSLVVDGDATVDGSLVDVDPTWAVLHRPAPSPLT